MPIYKVQTLNCIKETYNDYFKNHESEELLSSLFIATFIFL